MDSNTMSWLAWIIVGGIAGWLASLIMKNRLGLVWWDIAFGIAGAFTGGFLWGAVGAPGVTGFNPWSVVVAFIGAAILLGLVRLLGGLRTFSSSGY